LRHAFFAYRWFTPSQEKARAVLGGAGAARFFRQIIYIKKNWVLDKLEYLSL